MLEKPTRFDKNELINNCLDCLIDGTLQDITSLVYRTLSLPVTILDAGYTILARSPMEKIGDKYWDEALDAGGTPGDLIVSLREQKIMEYCFSHENATLLDFGDINYPRSVKVLRHDKITLGFISIYITHDIFPRSMVTDLVDTLGKIISVYIYKDPSFAKIHSSASEILISKLFNNQVTTANDLEKWESLAGIKLSGSYSVIALSDTEDLLGRLDFIEAQLILSNIQVLFAKKDCYRYYLIFGISSKKHWAVIKTEFEKHLSAVKIHLGHSILFDNILNLKAYMEQARESLKICLHDKLNSENKYDLGFKDVQHEIMLQKILDNLDEINYTHKYFVLLDNYDKTNQTNYLETLLCYLNCNCNTTKTTEKLFVHRNTTQYRLKKIEDICQFSFDDVQVCRALMLSAWTMALKNRLS